MRAVTMAVLVLSTGCGTGAVGEVVRPNGPTAAEALGEAPCLEVGQRDAPLIIDWPSDSRTDLEVAMQAGVAVVSYSCDELRLLSECQVSGDYGFVGVSRKEDFVQLDSRDEIRANLPVEGVTLSAGLASGSSLDLALITVGKRGSSRRELGHGDLTGDCAGATHFVRSAYVGAFAMEVGSVGRARTAAEVFGAGVSATSESKQTVARRDGSLEACRAATPDDEQPRDQCGAATRVQLYALSAAAPAKTALPTCPAGMVRTAEGACSLEKTGAYRCEPGNWPECEQQCDAGNAESCYLLGQHHGSASGTSPNGDAQRYGAKGCELDHGPSCDMAAERYAGEDPAEQREYAKKGCLLGDEDACRRATVALSAAGEDPGAFRMSRRACALGLVDGCQFAANALISGKGVVADPAAGLKLLETTCASGILDAGLACADAAERYNEGKGVEQDPDKGKALVEKACGLGLQALCPE